MMAKQEVFNDLNSDIFQANIYGQYIESLTDVLLSLNNTSEQKEIYIKNMKKYLEGKITVPEEVLVFK